MKTVEFKNGMELNRIGARFINGDKFVDVTEHYLSYGTVTADKGFGLGTECTEEEALEWLK